MPVAPKPQAPGIPSLGGLEIGPLLRRSARDAPAGTAIVEVGSWLGAGTAQLALGIRDRPDRDAVRLHAFDRWRATAREVEKALRRGVVLRQGEDTLPRTRQAIDPIGVPVTYHKQDISTATWNGGSISLYVDDACKRWPAFYCALLTFGPHWIPGETVVVLMDYNHWRRTGDTGHKCQKEFMELHDHCFESMNPRELAELPIQEAWRRPAVFRYTRRLDFGHWIARSCMERLEAAETEIRLARKLKDSTSWRITAPLRRLAAIARAVRAGSGFRRIG